MGADVMRVVLHSVGFGHRVDCCSAGGSFFALACRCLYKGRRLSDHFEDKSKNIQSARHLFNTVQVQIWPSNCITLASPHSPKLNTEIVATLVYTSIRL